MYDTSNMPIQYIKFCHEYALDENATRSAIAAGFSPASASQQGWLLKHKLQNILYIEWLRNEDMKMVGVTRENVIKELGKLAFHDPRLLYDDDGNIKHLKHIDDNTAAAIAGIEVLTDRDLNGKLKSSLHKIKLASRDSALDKLAKHFNIYEDHQKSGVGEMTVIIQGKDTEL